MLSKLYSSMLGKIELKSALKMGIAATLSLYAGLHFTRWIERPDPLASAIWCVIASIVVLQANIGGTYQAIFNRLSGVLIGSVTGAFVASLLGTEDVSLGLAVTGTMILCSLFNLKESYRIASLSVASVMIPWGINPLLSPWTFAFFRFLDTFIGIVIAMIVAIGIWPSPATIKMHKNFIRILSIIEQLYRYMFILKYRLDDEAKKAIQTLFKEFNQLFIQTHGMLEEARLETFLRHSNLSIWMEFLDNLEHLFNILYVSQNVINESLETIFDEQLKYQVDDLIYKIDEVFKELSSKLERQIPSSVLYMLADSENELNHEMLRFRNTHLTRKFNLQDIEKYFVFCYNLKMIVHELTHLSHLIDLTYLEKE